MGMRLLNAMACRTLLLAMGHQVGLRWMTGTIWVSSLGRYVPGKFAAGLGAAVMMTRRGVELTTALAVMFLYTALMTLISTLLAIPLLLTPHLREHYPVLGLATIGLLMAGIVAMHPRVFTLLCNFALRRLLRRNQAMDRPMTGPYVAAVVLLLVRVLLMGGCAFYAARVFTTITWHDYPAMLCGTAGATLAGFLAVFVPAGFGVQEYAFLELLGPILSWTRLEAGLLALLFRGLVSLADLLCGVIGLVILHPRFAGTRRAVRVAVGPAAGALDVAAIPLPDPSTAALPAAPISPLLLNMAHKPNFFIVGAPKCGTTSLYAYLRQHPDVFMPTHKEPHYFARDFDIPPEWCYRDDSHYVKLFAHAGNAARIGEASVWYLYSRSAANELKAFSPEARIIIMLRNPIDLMYSLHGQFLWNCNDDLLDFEEALAAQADRLLGRRIPPEAHMPAALQYTQVVAFSGQIQRYFEVFGRSNVQVVLFNDFQRDTAGQYRRVLEFLGLDADFSADLRIANPVKPITPRLNRYFARRPRLRKALHTMVPTPMLRSLNYALPYFLPVVQRPPRIDPRLREQLRPLFVQEIARLENLLGRDLSAWKI